MIRFPLYLAVALALAGCAGVDPADRVTRLIDEVSGDRPETRRLDPASLPRVDRPVWQSMQIRTLPEGETEPLQIRRFGNGYRVREASGCTWTRESDWFAPSDSWAACGSSKNWHTAQAQVRVLNSVFPLQEGATGRYERRATSHTGKTSTRTTECRVKGAEAVETPARGAVPAWVVLCDDDRIQRTTWYAPSIGPVAYREEHRERGIRDLWVRAD